MQLSLFSKVGAPDLAYVKVSEIKPWREPGEKGPRAVHAAAIGNLGFTGTVTLRRLLGEPYGYEVLDGARTLDLLVAEGWSEVPATVTLADELTGAAIGFSRNLSRSANPLDDAEAVRRFREAGLRDAEIAKFTGVPLGTVKKVAKLLELPEDLRNAVREGQVTPGVALGAVGLPGERLEPLRQKLRTGEKVTGKDVDAAQRVLREEAVAQLGTPLFDAEPPEAREVFLAAVNVAIASGLTADDLVEVVKEAGRV